MIPMIANYTIVELTFMGEPTGQFEVRREADNKYGYEVVKTVSTRPIAELLVAELSMPVNTPVTFRPEFSADLVGIEFLVDGEARISAENGRAFITVKTKRGGRWCYRLAYVTDLLVTGAAERTWRKIAPSAWKASDGRVIVHTPRKRLGRNGWRAAGYELSTTVNGFTLGFFSKLSDAKGAK